MMSAEKGEKKVHLARERARENAQRKIHVKNAVEEANPRGDPKNIDGRITPATEERLRFMRESEPPPRYRLLEKVREKNAKVRDLTRQLQSVIAALQRETSHAQAVQLHEREIEGVMNYFKLKWVSMK